MELVYLWVEEYKNIKNQGFNFSPRFKCDYNPKTNELTINENNDYIENFFGENINVTAIVGKNGSGKSSILNKIKELINFENFRNFNIYSNSFLLYIQNKKYYLLKKDELFIKINNDIINIESFNEYSTPNIFSFFSEMPYNTFSFFNDNLSGDLFMTPEEFEEMQRNEYTDLSIERIGEILVESKEYLYTIPKLNFIPKKIFIKNNNIFTRMINDNLALYIAKNIDPNEFNNELLNLINEIIEYEFNSFEILLIDILIRNCEEEIISGYMYKLQDIGVYSKMTNSFFKELYLDLKYKNMLTESIYLNNLSISDYYNLLDTEIIVESQNILTDLSKWNRLLVFNLIDEYNRKYTDLSYGEKILFGQLINFKYRIKKELIVEKNLFDLEIDFNENFSYYKNSFIFLIDEPDISLHPQWQKEYLNIVLNTLKKFDVNIHMVITTHSPFLLSDIPKQNIIFLDTDENGNCKVVDGLKEKKETFGANIHTLLSDSFFMEDGLMGEFAKSKIDEIIQFHNIVSKGRHKECLKKIYEKRKTKNEVLANSIHHRGRIFKASYQKSFS